MAKRPRIFIAQHAICFAAEVHLEEFCRRHLRLANCSFFDFSASTVSVIERALCSSEIALQFIPLFSSREYDEGSSHRFDGRRGETR